MNLHRQVNRRNSKNLNLPLPSFESKLSKTKSLSQGHTSSNFLFQQIRVKDSKLYDMRILNFPVFNIKIAYSKVKLKLQQKHNIGTLRTSRNFKLIFLIRSIEEQRYSMTYGKWRLLTFFINQFLTICPLTSFLSGLSIKSPRLSSEIAISLFPRQNLRENF